VIREGDDWKIRMLTTNVTPAPCEVDSIKTRVRFKEELSAEWPGDAATGNVGAVTRIVIVGIVVCFRPPIVHAPALNEY
jgi:hypothetical protein